VAFEIRDMADKDEMRGGTMRYGKADVKGKGKNKR
jgi:hypothetical protein